MMPQIGCFEVRARTRKGSGVWSVFKADSGTRTSQNEATGVSRSVGCASARICAMLPLADFCAAVVRFGFRAALY